MFNPKGPQVVRGPQFVKRCTRGSSSGPLESARASTVNLPAINSYAAPTESEITHMAAMSAACNILF
jgi:hypothetical protein